MPSPGRRAAAAELRQRRDSLIKRQQLLREEGTRDEAEENADKDRQEELEFRQMELSDTENSTEETGETAEFFDLEALEKERAETEESAEKLKNRRLTLQKELEEQIRNGRELESHRRPLVGRGRASDAGVRPD